MKSSEHPAEAARFAVFAKAPVAGKVKTRLAGLLGEEQAAQLHAELVIRALATASAASGGPVELWCAPDENHPFFIACAERFSLRLRRQPVGDLGERMRAAFEANLAAGHPLVLIGSDCPALGAGQLLEAAQQLRTHDAVVMPAEDGGYVLIGLSRPLPGLFADIEWGTDVVMERTRRALREAGASWIELPTSWDVDRPADYARLQGEGLLGTSP